MELVRHIKYKYPLVANKMKMRRAFLFIYLYIAYLGTLLNLLSDEPLG